MNESELGGPVLDEFGFSVPLPWERYREKKNQHCIVLFSSFHVREARCGLRLNTAFEVSQLFMSRSFARDVYHVSGHLKPSVCSTIANFKCPSRFFWKAGLLQHSKLPERLVLS